jgi:hypothetical protein
MAMKDFKYYSDNPVKFPSKENYQVVYVYDAGACIFAGSMAEYKTSYHGSESQNAVEQIVIDQYAYDKAKAAYNAAYNSAIIRLAEEFKHDLFQEFGDGFDKPTLNSMFNYAQDRGRSEGHKAVYDCFSDLVDVFTGRYGL